VNSGLKGKTSMASKDYRDLDIWQDGIRFVVALYQVTRQFPDAERFGLAGQLQRAAVSIPSNVAEGYAQRSDPTLARHLRIAIGSAAEVDTQLLIAQQLGYISTAQTQELREQCQSLLRRLRGFLASISGSHQPPTHR
jgi:four helix bundle protein